ncbi:MAG TPA: hypothetical protein VNP04_06610 [Alphaproteobacteria bacterium]|nr:hypothetical protein [Alphaproteobacteria bacterium]
MIPTLLWQCPICHTDDALRHTIHWFRPDEVRCNACATIWEVQRVIGDDYRLKVVAGESTWLGQQRPLAEWYDLMKAGIQLVARQAPCLRLQAGEEVYVQSRQALLLAEQDSLLFSRWVETEAPRQRQGDLGLSFMKKCDTGTLSLTNERLIWTGARWTLSFRLTKVTSVHTEITWYLGLLYGLCLYKFQFDEESILKWLTYIGYAAKRIEERYQHHISLSNY